MSPARQTWSPLRLFQSPVAEPVSWPDLGHMLSATHSRRSNIGRQLKLGWRLLRAAPYREGFLALLAQQPHWRPVFAEQARSWEPLMQSFLDRRLGVAQRFTGMARDLSTATQAFGVVPGRQIAEGRCIQVWELPGAARVELGLNEVCRREGLWALSLVSAQGIRLCQLSFSFLRAGRVTIGSIQGAPAQDEAAMQGVRDLTRSAEGLRPPHLLIEVLRAMCQHWGQALAGVDPQHHVKKKWHQPELKVSFDYRAFWTELGGHRQADEFWAVPVQRVPRELSDVPAKRRAMYRRRANLLAALPGQLQNLPLRPLASGA
jgi:hypothetical protein